MNSRSPPNNEVVVDMTKECYGAADTVSLGIVVPLYYNFVVAVTKAKTWQKASDYPDETQKAGHILPEEMMGVVLFQASPGKCGLPARPIGGSVLRQRLVSGEYAVKPMRLL